MRDAARAELDLACEITYLRALIALAARDGDADQAQALRAQLAKAGALADARARLAEPTPMARLAARLGLAPAEIELVWAIVAISADPRLAIPLDALGAGAARHGLAIAAYGHLRGLDAEVGRALARALSRGHPLVAGGLLQVADAAVPPASRQYLASERLLGYLVGDDAPGPGLRRVVPGAPLILDDAQQRALDELRTVVLGDAVVIVEGPRGCGRTAAIAAAVGGPVVVLDAARRERIDAATLVGLRREVVLGTAQPVIANADRLPAELAIGGFLDALGGPAIVTTAMPGIDLGSSRPVVRVRWPLPEVAVRRALWERAADQPTGDLDALAMRYRIGAGVIARAVASVRAQRGDPDGRIRLDAADLAAGLRHNIAEELGGLAYPVEVTQRWDDLVIADDTRDHIQALIARVRHAHRVLGDWQYRSKIARGTGVPALFSGPPGTGKTMVAGLIARELDLELYQVDLSQIVSKWVGETEKQLARVFDAAEQGHALLLFDEADALFGQRTQDVKGAVDRYANLEVNYLLQRVEAFGGITILTTNLDAAIDRALKRRLAAHIVFELPDEDERAQLWHRVITTATAPLARNLDVDQLARGFPKMSGANIRNAALAAAFLAAAEQAAVITQHHLLRAARAEYRSMGYVLGDAVGGAGRGLR